MEIFVPQDCGNAPRKRTLIEFMTHVVNKEIDQLEALLHEEVRLHRVKEQKELMGKTEVLREISQLEFHDLAALHFDYVITHGKTTSVNGRLLFDDETTLHFHDVIEFSQAGRQGKIKLIKSFWLEEKDNQYFKYCLEQYHKQLIEVDTLHRKQDPEEK